MHRSWVAGSVRARSLTRRRLGWEGVRSVASSPSLGLALRRLADSPYGQDIRVDLPLAEAQRAVSATALWHVRVLAGWLPGGGAEVLRTIAGYWEIANVSLVLGSLLQTDHPPLFELGGLGTVPGSLREARQPADVRAALRRSPWGDPATDDPAVILGWMRLRWAEWLATSVPGASRWASGLLGILIARELFVAGRRPDRRGWPTAPLPRGWEAATSIPDLAARLPADARWSLEGVDGGAQLWRAEAGWWAAIERAAVAEQARFRPGRRQGVVASVALLGVDAWRTRAALALAAHGGQPLEAMDALG